MVCRAAALREAAEGWYDRIMPSLLVGALIVLVGCVGPAATPSAEKTMPEKPAPDAPVAKPPEPKPTAAKTFTIRKGETLEALDGLRVTFKGHGHKTAMVSGPSSPLIIYLGFEHDGQTAEQEFQVFDQDKVRAFEWGDFVFELLDHRYDDWMKLTVRRK